MNKRDIKRALSSVEQMGGDPDKVILAVPFKRGKEPYDRAEVIAEVARGNMEPVATTKANLKGYANAAYVKASSAVGDYYVIEGYAAFLRDEGKWADSQHGMEVITFHPDALNLAGAWIVDDDMEHHRDLHRAVWDSDKSPRHRSARY